MTKFLRTTDREDCPILINVADIDYVWMYDQENDENNYKILIFGNKSPEAFAIASESFDDSTECRARFTEIELLLNNKL